MRQLILHVLAGVVVLAPVSAPAATMECKSEMPAAPTGYWSWRIIDGKRCWYLGRPGIAKTQLQWPGAAAVPARVPRSSKRALPEPYAIEAEASSPNVEELPFEKRWPR